MRNQSQGNYLPAELLCEPSRRQGHRPKKRNILIVCEGKQTEPNYFKSFCRQLVGGEGDRVEIIGIGDNTVHLVEETKKIIEMRQKSDAPPFYYVWVVFDKDEFPDDQFDNAIKVIEQEDKKFKAGVRPHWFAAWSNEAFELWYLLHFQETLGGAVDRNEMCRKLSDYFHSELKVVRGYCKNDTTIFKLLLPYLPKALESGERALKKWYGHPPHACNPATCVVNLVKQLYAYM